MPAAPPPPDSLAVSSPGKLILLGEHAAVYGRPALVAAIDRRLCARFARLAVPEVELDLRDLGDLGHRERLSWAAVRGYAEAAGGRWQRHAAGAGFHTLRGEDPAHVVKVALGEAAAFLERRGHAVAGLRLEISSDLPVGSGFGSSAATAVAVAGGLCHLAGLAVTAAELEPLALVIERRQHGHPSGIDTAATLHGGVLWAEKQPDGALAHERVELRSPHLARLEVYDTGTPPEPTGAVVAAVRALYHRHPERIEAVLDRLAAAALALRLELERTDGEPRRLGELFREGAAGLAELGVVPEPVQSLIDQIERQGGAAKISGAGSLAGPGAGSLLVYHSDAGPLAPWPFLAGLRSLPLRLGAPGFRLEPET